MIEGASLYPITSVEMCWFSVWRCDVRRCSAVPSGPWHVLVCVDHIRQFKRWCRLWSGLQNDKTVLFHKLSAVNVVTTELVARIEQIKNVLRPLRTINSYHHNLFKKSIRGHGYNFGFGALTVTFESESPSPIILKQYLTKRSPVPAALKLLFDVLVVHEWHSYYSLKELVH